ncbi:MAG: UDP-N-acetylglucosamine 1-carboxyvinyltransferase, partial [Fibrobacterota bacterium]
MSGKKRLAGTLAVSGNKNEALPLIAGSLVNPSETILENTPDIGDVRGMCRIAEHLGARISRSGNSLTIQPGDMQESSLPLELSRKIRGSILFASALLVRT